MEQLPYDSATSRSMNGDRPVWSVGDHLTADLWSLILQVNSREGTTFVDNPRRVQMELDAYVRDKESRIDQLKAAYRAKKIAYGMDVQ